MENEIKCTQCRFVRIDRDASEKGWKAYECGNRNSEYYKALLNVTPRGEMLKRITWEGCEEGEEKE